MDTAALKVSSRAPTLRFSVFWGSVFNFGNAAFLLSLQKNQSQGVSPPAVKPPAASPAPLSSCNPRTGCKSLQHFWGAEGGGEAIAPGSGSRCRLARGPGPRAPGACSRPPPDPRPGSPPPPPQPLSQPPTSAGAGIALSAHRGGRLALAGGFLVQRGLPGAGGRVRAAAARLAGGGVGGCRS